MKLKVYNVISECDESLSGFAYYKMKCFIGFARSGNKKCRYESFPFPCVFPVPPPFAFPFPFPLSLPLTKQKHVFY